MTRDEFLNELSSRLNRLNQQERDNVLNYYLEYFEERGVGANDSIPPDIASPAKIADEILQDIPFTQTQAGASSAGNDPEPIPMTYLDELDVKLNLGGLEIELFDETSPQLIRPRNAEGIRMDYELTWRVEGGKLIIRDKFKDNWIQSHKRINLDPVVLKIPRGSHLKTVLVNVKMGSTRIFGLTSDRLTLVNTMGSISLRGGETGFLDASLEMGSIKVENTTIHGSSINVSMGDLRGRARLLGQHKLECQMGSIRLQLDQPRSQTALYTQVSMGSFRINGEKAGFPFDGRYGGGGYSDSAGNGSAGGNAPLATLNMRCSMGSVNLDFLQ